MSESKRVRVQPDRAAARAKRIRNLAEEFSPAPFKRYPPFNPPITDYKKVPGGWNGEDEDIDEKDVARVIQRCHDRIHDGIMPQWWEKKLAVYQGIQNKVDSVKASENSKMSLEAAMRVENLEVIKEHLETEGDPFTQLVNVTALIDGYRNGTLVWQDMKVSNWSAGKCMAGPMKFDMTFEDVKRYNAQCGGKSFWVEGLNGPGAVPMLAYNNPAWKCEIRPMRMLLHQHEIDTHFRVPGAGSPVSNTPFSHFSSQRKFLDDTGSSMPIIYQDDVRRITAYAGGSKPPFLCYINSLNAGRNTAVDPTCLIEYNIRSTLPGYGWMRPAGKWVTVQTIMKQHNFDPAQDYRLSGMWMRRILYTATAPDNLGLFYMTESLTTLKASLPESDVRNAVPQPFYGPSDPGVSSIGPTIYVKGMLDVPP